VGHTGTVGYTETVTATYLDLSVKATAPYGYFLTVPRFSAPATFTRTGIQVGVLLIVAMGNRKKLCVLHKEGDFTTVGHTGTVGYTETVTATYLEVCQLLPSADTSNLTSANLVRSVSNHNFTEDRRTALSNWQTLSEGKKLCVLHKEGDFTTVGHTGTVGYTASTSLNVTGTSCPCSALHFSPEKRT